MSSPPKPRAPLLVRLQRAAILSLLGLCLLALLLLAATAAVQATLETRIAPGVRIGDLALDGLTREETADALTERYGAAETVAYTLLDGEKSWTASAAELGLRLPVDALVERAFAIGHADTTRQSLQELAQAWLEGVDIPLSMIFDETVALDYLRMLAREIDRERRDATLLIRGLHVAIDVGESRRQLDIAATLERLRKAVLTGQGASIDLAIDESQPRAWNVTEAARKVHTALASPLWLYATGRHGQPLPPWQITPLQIRQALTVMLLPAGDSMRFDVQVDLGAFRPFLMSLTSALSSQPVDSRLDFEPASGQLRALTPSAIGRHVDVDETLRRLEAAVFTRDERRVDMVFVNLPPRFHEESNAAELGIRELVAEATTFFWGSPQNRRDNIGLGVSKLHGIAVAPGEEFSFNRELGAITATAGYLEGSVILGGATVAGIGGGICQVSTTMYRAALNGGYAITQRHSHGYRVGYYEYAGAGPGLDAAIWQPTVDLRFRNNTPHHLLIESAFLPAQNALQFRIYSTRHWTTRIETPLIADIIPPPPDLYIEADDLLPGQIRQIDWSVPGADVVVWRNIYDVAGAQVERQRIFTRYQPWQAVYEVAAGDPRLPVEEAAPSNEDEQNGESL